VLPVITNESFCSRIIKSVATIGALSWRINKDIYRKLSVIETGFWRRHVRKTLLDEVRNDVIKEEVKKMVG
jgi:hypothetical protein